MNNHHNEVDNYDSFINLKVNGVQPIYFINEGLMLVKMDIDETIMINSIKSHKGMNKADGFIIIETGEGSMNALKRKID